MLTFDEATHTYTLDGVRFPSVTEVTRFCAYDYKSERPWLAEAAARRGTAVHEACALIDYGEEPEETPEIALLQSEQRLIRGYYCPQPGVVDLYTVMEEATRFCDTLQYVFPLGILLFAAVCVILGTILTRQLWLLSAYGGPMLLARIPFDLTAVGVFLILSFTDWIVRTAAVSFRVGLPNLWAVGILLLCLLGLPFLTFLIQPEPLFPEKQLEHPFQGRPFFAERGCIAVHDLWIIPDCVRTLSSLNSAIKGFLRRVWEPFLFLKEGFPRRSPSFLYRSPQQKRAAMRP